MRLYCTDVSSSQSVSMLYRPGIVGQRNLALGLISFTEAPQHITALVANVHMPHVSAYTRRFCRGKKMHVGVRLKSGSKRGTVGLQCMISQVNSSSSRKTTVQLVQCSLCTHKGAPLINSDYHLPLTANLQLKKTCEFTCISK